MADNILLKTDESVTHINRFKAECKVKFSDFPNEVDYKCESTSFKLAGCEWCFEIYPNGRSRGTRNGGVTVCLKLKSSPPKFPVNYVFGIKKTRGNFFKHVRGTHLFKKKGARLGYLSFCRRFALTHHYTNIVSTDGYVTFFCKVTIENKVISGLAVASPTPFSDGEEMSKNFKELLLNGYHADVTLVVQGKEFKGHRCVLAARSEVFRFMFESDMKEKFSGIVKIEDCNPNVFRRFLLFVYSGNFDLVTVSNALELCLVADKYNVLQLKRACLEKLANGISAESVCDVAYLASLYNEYELLKTATEYFINNFVKIVSSKKWESFLGEHTHFANSLLITMANNNHIKMANKA